MVSRLPGTKDVGKVDALVVLLLDITPCQLIIAEAALVVLKVWQCKEGDIEMIRERKGEVIR